MEYQISKEKIQMNELVFHQVTEQGIELDYMMPDYCTDVFKVLRVQLKPHILSERISGSKLMIDGVADIKVIYLGEEGGRLSCIEQKQAFSKSIDLKEDCSDGYASVRAKCDYVNCRAQNSRRLDIKGAISITVCVYKNRSVDAVSGCSDLQIHKKKVSSSNRKLFVSKEFSVREELAIGSGKPPIREVLDYMADAQFSEYKLLANKVICKGELNLRTMYLAESMTVPESIEHSIPLSQIMDCDGVDEEYTCTCRFDVVKYDIDLQMTEEGKCELFVAEIGIRVYCEAAYNKEIEIIDDCYSTAYEIDQNTEKHEVERMSQTVRESSLQKHTIKLNQNDIRSVYDLCCDITNVSCKTENGALMVLCNLQASFLACDSEGMPVSMEHTIPCEIPLAGIDCTHPVSFSPDVCIASCAYNIVSPDEIELRAELRISGIVYHKQNIRLITEVSADEERRKTRSDDAALRLYFADEGESIWNIAKRYNTSVSAILEQNSVETEVLSQRGMIFIPIVD